MRFPVSSTKIVVLGAGGTGSKLLRDLYQLAHDTKQVDQVIVCDGDAVENKNLRRQNFLEQDIGENKARVLSERYAGAFGMQAKYVPRYIETLEELEKLIRLSSPPFGPKQVILIGCVDNNRSRRLCHEAFCRAKELIYIDSGNGESTGQVVCGIRRSGRTVWKPVGGFYPEMLKDTDKFPTELSCAEQSVSAPQSITANITAAAAILSFLYAILVTRKLDTRHITFSTKSISMQSKDTAKRRKAS